MKNNEPHFWQICSGSWLKYLLMNCEVEETNEEIDDNAKYEIWTYPYKGSYDNGYTHKILQKVS